MKNWLQTSRAALVACVIGLLFITGNARAATPTVAITSPNNGLRTTNVNITVTGTARSSDTNDPLASVTVFVNGVSQTADGTTGWQANATLTPGDNVISAQSTTMNNVQSATVTRHVTLQVFSMLTVATTGNGKVSPDLNGSTQLVGQSLHMQAIPASDWTFTGWTGTTNSTNANLTFTMSENANLTANFAPNPLHFVRGTYNGLIMNTNNIEGDSSGAFTLMVNNPNTYVLTFTVGGTRATATGRFDNDGQANFTAHAGGNTYTGTLQLDLSGVSDQVTGELNTPITASLVGDRDVFNLQTNLCPFAGQYTMIVSSNAAVDGQGVATISVDGAGNLRMNGTLADGTPISQSTTVSKAGYWPLFVSLYGNKGAFTGWIDITNIPQSSLNGNANWFHPALTHGAYSNEFSLRTPVIGSLFIQPPTGVSMMAWTDGFATFTGDNLSIPVSSGLTWSSNNTINVDFNDFTFHVGPSGTLRGTLTMPVTHRVDTVQGVILQKTNWAGGLFLDSGISGSFYMGEDLTAGTNVIVNAPGDINTGVLTLTLQKKSGVFTKLGAITINIGATTVTTDINGFGTASYNYSSYSSFSANIAELNIIGGSLQNKTTIIRMFLHFIDNQSGTFLATVTAGGTGTATGTFTLP
jgi:uncharacterized repeat protein (TIGR02543 family)